MLVMQLVLLQVQTVVHAVHTCHSLLLELSPRALEMVAGVMSDLLDFFVPNFMPLLLEAGSIGETRHVNRRNILHLLLILFVSLPEECLLLHGNTQLYIQHSMYMHSYFKVNIPR
jgi:hypothetical protein